MDNVADNTKMWTNIVAELILPNTNYPNELNPVTASVKGKNNHINDSLSKKSTV